MTFLIDLVRRYLLPAVIWALIAAVFAAAVWYAGARHERAKWMDKETAWAKERATLKADVAGANKAVAQLEAAIAKAAAAVEKQQSAHRAQITRAKKDAKKRETKLAGDVDRARRARDGLRDDITTALNRLSADNAAAAAARDRVGRAALHALGECGERYGAVAKEADRCDIERRTLIDAWPK